MLVYEVFKRIVPEGGIPLDVGVVVLNVETLYNIASALEDRPVIEKYLTVAGEVKKRRARVRGDGVAGGAAPAVVAPPGCAGSEGLGAATMGGGGAGGEPPGTTRSVPCMAPLPQPGPVAAKPTICSSFTP